MFSGGGVPKCHVPADPSARWSLRLPMHSKQHPLRLSAVRRQTEADEGDAVVPIGTLAHAHAWGITKIKTVADPGAASSHVRWKTGNPC